MKNRIDDVCRIGLMVFAAGGFLSELLVLFPPSNAAAGVALMAIAGILGYAAVTAFIILVHVLATALTKVLR